jgi:hypothetical protein
MSKTEIKQELFGFASSSHKFPRKLPDVPAYLVAAA